MLRGLVRRSAQMSSSGQKRKNLPLVSRTATLVYLCVSVFLAPAFQNPIRANQSASTDATGPVLKGAEPVGIIGNVVAMTRDLWMGAGWSVHILLIRVDSVLDGKKTERYVRADFLNHSVYDNSEESIAYDKFVTAFHDKGTWRIQLHPPRGAPECWKVPPPPIQGDLMSRGNPDIQPVGGATGYPSINTVPCYSFTTKDVQQVRSPETTK
jgi:hypothetical protein